MCKTQKYAFSGVCVCVADNKHYAGMDKTNLDTSSGTLFVREGGCLRMSMSRRT